MELEKKICIKCEWSNPVHVKFCEMCNASLPVIIQHKEEMINFLEKTSVSKIVDIGWYSPKFKKLMDASEMVMDNTISRTKFKHIVEELHRAVIKELNSSNGVKSNLKKYVKEKHSDRADEIMELCMEGLYTYDDAFEEIKLYFNDNNIIHIQDGLQMALDAKNKLCDSLSLLDEGEGEYSEILKKVD